MFCPPHHLAIPRYDLARGKAHGMVVGQVSLLNPVQSGRILNILTVSLLMM